MNSVFAVNGIGKSSIFEALYYAIYGAIPKLQSLQTQERPQDYYAFIRKERQSSIWSFGRTTAAVLYLFGCSATRLGIARSAA